MKFTTEINAKAWEIYRLIVKPSMTKDGRRSCRKHAFKVAFAYFKSLRTNKISFWKLETGEVVNRRVAEAPFSRKGMLVYIDLDKLQNNNPNNIISFNHYQLA